MYFITCVMCIKYSHCNKQTRVWILPQLRDLVSKLSFCSFTVLLLPGQSICLCTEDGSFLKMMVFDITHVALTTK